MLRGVSAALRFLLVTLAVHLVLCGAYRITVVRSHEVTEADRAFFQRDRSVRVLVAGDSHPRMNVVDELLPGAVNVATRGEDYLKNRYRVPWLLDRDGEGIDAVVLGFDAASFSDTRLRNFRPEAVWSRYVPLLALGPALDDRRGFGTMWLKANLAPYAGEVDMVAQWVARRRSFRDPGQVGTVAPVKFQWGDEAAERHFPEGSGWHPMLERGLRELVTELAARDVRLVLVSYPVTAEYSQAVERRGADEARRERLLAELVAPGVVDHLDYESLGWGNRALFGDADHLSPIGAKLFTRRLHRDLAGLGLLEPPPGGP